MKPWQNSKYYDAISSDYISKYQGVPCHLTSLSVVCVAKNNLQQSSLLNLEIRWSGKKVASHL